jgi:hypothetical protein
MKLSTEEIIIIITLLISLSVYFQKPTPLYLKLFPVYLGLILIFDFYFIFFPTPKFKTGEIANITDIIEFGFFYFVLREIIQNSRMKKILLYLLFFLPLLAALNIAFFQQHKGYNTINFSIGCLLTVILCIYYYFELLQGTQNKSLARLPAFWIVTAIFFNNVCTFPIFAFVTYMKKPPSIIIMNISMIFLMVTLFSAILYSIGFLCRIRIRKSTL